MPGSVSTLSGGHWSRTAAVWAAFAVMIALVSHGDAQSGPQAAPVVRTSVIGSAFPVRPEASAAQVTQFLRPLELDKLALESFGDNDEPEVQARR